MKEKSNSHIDPDKVKRKQKIRCDCQITALSVRVLRNTGDTLYIEFLESSEWEI